MTRLQFGLPLLFLVVGCAHPKTDVKQATSTTPVGTVSKEAAAATPAPAVDSSAGIDRNACLDIKVHFQLNSAQIAEGDKPLLERSAQCLKQDKKLHVTIEGNADERGTEEYNLALGDERARSVATYLERLGTSGLQLKTVSYGKEQPECTEHDESCWSKNRRAAIKANK